VTVNGCTVAAGLAAPPNETSKFGYTLFSCTSNRSVSIGTCIDRLDGASWVAVTCTGAKTVVATQELQVGAATGNLPNSIAGKYRVRARIEGYGTALSYFAN
jgi:hypothetical protein